MSIGLSITPFSSSLRAFQKKRRIFAGFSRILRQNERILLQGDECFLTDSCDMMLAIPLAVEAESWWKAAR